MRHAAGAHPRRRFLGAEASDERDGDQRGRDEHRVVEDELVARHAALVVQHGRRENQGDRGEQGHEDADALTLDMCVNGEERERDEADRPVCLRHDRLDRAEHHEVARRDQRVERAVGAAPREDQVEHAPRQREAEQDHREPPLVREPQRHADNERQRRDAQARDREHHDRLARCEREAAQAPRHGQAPTRSGARRRRCAAKMRPAATAAPMASISTSRGVPTRPDTNVWCSSSVQA